MHICMDIHTHTVCCRELSEYPWRLANESTGTGRELVFCGLDASIWSRQKQTAYSGLWKWLWSSKGNETVLVIAGDFARAFYCKHWLGPKESACKSLHQLETGFAAFAWRPASKKNYAQNMHNMQKICIKSKIHARYTPKICIICTGTNMLNMHTTSSDDDMLKICKINAKQLQNN